MKKILLGCGCLVLLCLGGLGFLAYRLAPGLIESFERIEVVNKRFAELDERFPYQAVGPDGLAVDRFEAVLDARVSLRHDTDRWEAAVAAAAEEGVIALMSTVFDFSPLVEPLPDELEQRGLGPTEFSAHTRLLWVALASIDSGVPGPGLADLRGRWAEMRGRYDRLQRRYPQQLQRLDDVLGSFPSEIVEQARTAMAHDPQRVLDGMTETVLEIVYLSIPPMSEDLTSACVQILAESVEQRAQQREYELR